MVYMFFLMTASEVTETKILHQEPRLRQKPSGKTATCRQYRPHFRSPARGTRCPLRNGL